MEITTNAHIKKTCEECAWVDCSFDSCEQCPVWLDEEGECQCLKHCSNYNDKEPNEIPACQYFTGRKAFLATLDIEALLDNTWNEIKKSVPMECLRVTCARTSACAGVHLGLFTCPFEVLDMRGEDTDEE